MNKIHVLVISYELYNYSSVGHCARKIIVCLDRAGVKLTVVTRPLGEQLVGDACQDMVIDSDRHIFVSSDSSIVSRLYVGLTKTVFSRFLSKINNIFKRRLVFNIDSWFWCKNVANVVAGRAEKLDYDAVLSISIPQESHEAAWRLRQRIRKVWVAYFSDPWPEFCNLPSHNWQDNTFDVTLALMLKKHAKAADVLAITNERMSKRMASYFPDVWDHSKVCIIPHIISAYKTKVSRTNDFLQITHAGHLSAMARGVYPLMLREFFSGFSRALRKHSLGPAEVKITFVGVLDDPCLNDYLTEFEIQDYFDFVPKQSYKQTAAFLDAADVLLVMERRSDEGIYFLSKITDYLAYQKPVAFVSPSIGATRDMLPRLDFSACPGDESQIYEMWNKVFTDWRDSRLFEKIIPQSELEHLHSSTVSEKLRGLFKEKLHGSL